MVRYYFYEKRLSNLRTIHMVRENEQINVKVAIYSLVMVVASFKSSEHEITSERNHTQMLSFPKIVVLRKDKIKLGARYFDSTVHEPMA